LKKDEYAQRKQKFKDKSNLIALNSTFKTIKNSFDDVKALITELGDSKSIKNKMSEIQQQFEEKEDYSKSIELYSRVKHQKAILEEKGKYLDKQNFMQSQIDEHNEKAKKIKDEMSELDSKARVLRARKKMLLKENSLLTDQAGTVTSSILSNQVDLSSSLKDKDKQEVASLETLQQMFYAETVKMANLCEDVDKITEFVYDFVRSAAQSTKKRQSMVSLRSFGELQDEDKDNINDLLSGLNI
jgi:chromosome segregation ATPase